MMIWSGLARRTATERDGRIEASGEDIAASILYAVTQPERVNVNILTLYPAEQA
jgi:NADP-dependent 3-hydroxy acid dehydrogenase YdfG